MKPIRSTIFGVTLSTMLCLPACHGQTDAFTSEDLFKSTVRSTEPLTPTEELAALRVPEGFRISLFASEPQIQKPLNMAFDADGRLWVTGSNHYPHPAEDSSGTDTIRILEDTTGDGTADKVTTFADDLNIPMGLYPYKDGVIVFSIPNILFLRDTDSDGKADERKILYGPFDTTRDTHGMNNAFRRGFDGWLYCCHGFNNESEVAGADGNKVSMHSGNTYRIRLDGSRIEHFTHGQVNPFGMTIDANGDLFNSDCHTKPVSLLIRDGWYESFGKPHDGLGFVPNVMDHLHGSTAIDALCQYQGNVFPDEYHDNLFVGNVMTCRIHRNSIVRSGSSVSMQEEDDLLESDDPWFRPVDMQCGPDGAIYIADFYNRVIGHYEVPLDHPGRDQHRGRIWKVSWIGTDGNARETATEIPKLSKYDTTELIAALSDIRKGVRQHAADQLVDRLGNNTQNDVAAALTSAQSRSSQTAVPQLLWALHRMGSLTSGQLIDSYTKGAERTRIHVMRICSERTDTLEIQDLIRSGLRDPKSLVHRAAADAAAQHPSVLLAKEVINLTVTAPRTDVHLLHALKIALRNQFRSAIVVKWFTASPAPAVAIDAVTTTLPALTGELVGELSVYLLRNGNLASDQTVEIVKHGVKYSTDQHLEALTAIVTALPSGKIIEQTEIWAAMSDALRMRKKAPPANFQQWSEQLAHSVFRSIDYKDVGWGQYSLAGEPFVTWGLEPRFSQGSSKEKSQFLSSLPGGERGVGVLRSRPFVLPFDLTVRVCGHLGNPKDSAIPRNRIVLRDLKSGEAIHSALAPRNDVAAVIEWNLKGFAGRRAYLEVVDGLNESSYAWIGVGKPGPPVFRPDIFDAGAAAKQLASAIKIIRNQQLKDSQLKSADLERMKKIIESVQLGGAVRTLAAQSLLLHFNQASVLSVTDLLQIANTPHEVENMIMDYCRGTPGDLEEYASDSPQRLINGIFSRIDRSIRKRLVKALSESAAGANLLISAIDAGTPSAEILRDDRLVQQLSGYGPEVADRVQRLRTNLPPETQEHKKLAESVLRRLRLNEGNADEGHIVFRKHCMGCHRRNNEGGLAGPQLDAIATRGAARLLEDILQPNQNVDINFRTSTLVLNDGRVISGIVRTTPPPSVLLRVIGTDGKTKDVSGDDVEERKDSRLSLMPANVTTAMTEDELLNLITWLMK